MCKYATRELTNEEILSHIKGRGRNARQILAGRPVRMMRATPGQKIEVNFTVTEEGKRYGLKAIKGRFNPDGTLKPYGYLAFAIQ